jgi:hypothetical protein
LLRVRTIIMAIPATSFSSNELCIIFDKVLVNITILDSRIDVGLDPEIMVSAKYAYDSEGFSGKYIKLKTPTTPEIGEVAYTVESIFDPLYGLTAFSSNTATCIWDRINIFDGGVSEETSNIGNMETVWFKARYEYDGEEFTDQNGVLCVNNVPLSWSSHDGQWKYSTTLDEPGRIVLEVTGVEDNKYGLTVINDEVGPLTIT